MLLALETFGGELNEFNCFSTRFLRWILLSVIFKTESVDNDPLNDLFDRVNNEQQDFFCTLSLYDS